jgi:hypothetical protein
VLDAALDEGGWFDQAHEQALQRAATAESASERLALTRSIVDEQTRLGMLVGAAVGLELAQELMRRREETES